MIWPTQAQRDEVQARFGSDAVNLVAPHGIPLPTVSDAQREPGLVVSVSRIAPGKRIDHLVRAFLAAAVPGTRLEIWGDGPSTASVTELISTLEAGDRVRLMGRTDDPAAVLRRASLMVTATAFEGQGLSIVEALAAGCPVISYDVRYGPGDVLRDGGEFSCRPETRAPWPRRSAGCSRTPTCTRVSPRRLPSPHPPGAKTRP
ncbi:hypothetical protein GCM10025863_17340 [Microbacterium suwonense]|uniref:Glycosyl transferase family 1 domain-containing protein n=1 Tax=Microbacterium suwonense TaxID=683047 RepID=A0ABM8FTW7_9MICO|nr:hypothetical protein GCM10025863_17340 [Microbacterium suwonense]